MHTAPCVSWLPERPKSPKSYYSLNCSASGQRRLSAVRVEWLLCYYLKLHRDRKTAKVKVGPNGVELSLSVTKLGPPKGAFIGCSVLTRANRASGSRFAELACEGLPCDKRSLCSHVSGFRCCLAFVTRPARLPTSIGSPPAQLCDVALLRAHQLRLPSRPLPPIKAFVVPRH
jgi:hypothetical protein